MKPLISLGITSGEPSGIGPEVSLQAASLVMTSLSTLDLPFRLALHIYGDEAVLAQAAKVVQLVPQFTHWLRASETPIKIVPIACQHVVQAGQLNVQNSAYVLRLLDEVLTLNLKKQLDGMVTAPIQKSVILEAGLGTINGVKFSGHTEYLAAHCNHSDVVMMLMGPTLLTQTEVSEWLKVALVTTHIPLHQVSSGLNQATIVNKIKLIHDDVKKWLGRPPHIAVCGLNPHAGENGHLGLEEKTIIEPAITQAVSEGFHVSGAYAADTLFIPRNLKGIDVVLAMYHDQGLAPLKLATQGNGVNISLGLPVTRTSPDHGTALGIAGKGLADPTRGVMRHQTSPKKPKRTLSGHAPNKQLGQNFLVDQSILHEIVACISPQPDDLMLEIGPGLGALTECLLPKLNHLWVVELDVGLAKRLERHENLTVFQGDILQFDFAKVLRQEQPEPLLRVVGNLPYQISSPLLFYLMNWADRIKDQHFLLQKEVVDR
ncbi:unnamed protein product, partial [Darwinula stevensoni]